jgi:hypothetical protein
VIAQSGWLTPDLVVPQITGLRAVTFPAVPSIFPGDACTPRLINSSLRPKK